MMQTLSQFHLYIYIHMQNTTILIMDGTTISYHHHSINNNVYIHHSNFLIDLESIVCHSDKRNQRIHVCKFGLWACLTNKQVHLHPGLVERLMRHLQGSLQSSIQSRSIEPHLPRWIQVLPAVIFLRHVLFLS